MQNAGNLAQGWRTAVYHTLLTTSIHTHVLTCDYRGFGRSTGYPTEAGLITDGVALTSYILDDLEIAAKRVALLGQSLGTAVASATALHFANPDLINISIPKASVNGDEKIQQHLFPRGVVAAPKKKRTDTPVTFASVTLIAPFANIPDLLQTYRIGGIVPVLSPLRAYPKLQKIMRRYVVDTWDTDRRIEELVRIHSASSSEAKMRLQVLHSQNDMDISYRQSLQLFNAAARGAAQPKEGERVWNAATKGARGRIGRVETKGIEAELEIHNFGGMTTHVSLKRTVEGLTKSCFLREWFEIDRRLTSPVQDTIVSPLSRPSH